MARLDSAQRERLAQAQQRRPRGLNENYARELLELHTLGVDGGYGQQDVSGATGAKLLLYRVLRFGSGVEVLHEFGAGQVSTPAAGVSEVTHPQQLLAESSDSTNLLVSTSGGREVLSVRSSACAHSGAVPTSETIPTKLDAGDSPGKARAPLAVSRTLAFVEQGKAGLVVGTISNERMELWICPQESVCTRRSSLRAPQLTVASFPCDKSICSIVQSHRESLVILRQRIE